jgi:hypothetical protein
MGRVSFSSRFNVSCSSFLCGLNDDCLRPFYSRQFSFSVFLVHRHQFDHFLIQCIVFHPLSSLVASSLVIMSGKLYIVYLLMECIDGNFNILEEE